MKICSQIPHVQGSRMNFDRLMSDKYMSRIKNAVMEAVWKGLCPDLFMLLKKGMTELM